MARLKPSIYEETQTNYKSLYHRKPRTLRLFWRTTRKIIMYINSNISEEKKRPGLFYIGWTAITCPHIEIYTDSGRQFSFGMWYDSKRNERFYFDVILF